MVGLVFGCGFWGKGWGVFLCMCWYVFLTQRGTFMIFLQGCFGTNCLIFIICTIPYFIQNILPYFIVFCLLQKNLWHHLRIFCQKRLILLDLALLYIRHGCYDFFFSINRVLRCWWLHVTKLGLQLRLWNIWP